MSALGFGSGEWKPHATQLSSPYQKMRIRRWVCLPHIKGVQIFLYGWALRSAEHFCRVQGGRGSRAQKARKVLIWIRKGEISYHNWKIGTIQKLHLSPNVKNICGGQQDGSVGKGAWCQAWRPEFHSPNPQSRRTDCCRMFSALHMHTCHGGTCLKSQDLGGGDRQGQKSFSATQLVWGQPGLDETLP